MMKNLLLMMAIMSGFIGHAFGSEKNNEIYRYTAYVRDNEPLVSCDKEYIDSFNKTCGTQYKYDDHFFRVHYDADLVGKLPYFIVIVGDKLDRPQDWLQEKKKVSESIKFLPFNSFLHWRTGVKSAGETVLGFSRKNGNQEKIFDIRVAPFKHDELQKFKQISDDRY